MEDHENKLLIIDDSIVSDLSGVSSVRPEVHVATDESQPMPPSPEVLSFYKRYNSAMQAWFKANGNTKFPIVEDPKTGKLFWINREQRRKNAKR